LGVAVTVKKNVYGVSFVLLLTLSAVAGFLLVNFASADYGVLTIYIRSNGSVEGTDLIQRNGNVYTFTGNIGVFNQTISDNVYLGGIDVQRDNIVIDGAGYNLTGSGLYGYINPFYNPPILINTAGIYTGRSNVTIKNLTVQNFLYGISLQYNTNITVLNSVLRSEQGVIAYNSEQLTLVNCKLYDPGYGSGYGVYLQNVTHSLIYNDTFANTTYGINGGYGSWDGATRYNNDYNVIVNNQFIRNDYAIDMGPSSYNIFLNNIIQNGSYWLLSRDTWVWMPGEGIDIGGEGNIVCGNHISGNKFAIQTGGKDNLFYRNTIANNTVGVVLHKGTNITFYSNNFINNEIDVQGSSVFWGKGSVGNYWSKYNGSDWTRDGKGDTPYVINSENQDDYPNMTPFNIDSASAQLPAWAQEKLRSLGIAVEEPTQETTPEPFPVALVIAASGASIAIIGVSLLVYFKKRKIKSGIKHE
jgi:nitrous oxidase accessory protein NosD